MVIIVIITVSVSKFFLNEYLNFTYLNQLLFATAQVATLSAIIFSSLIILSTEKRGIHDKIQPLELWA